MYQSLLIILFLLSGSTVNDKIRKIEYEGKNYLTTFNAPEGFLGKYTGEGKGFLELKPDGTGEYVYDFFGFTKGECPETPIEIEWGFLVENDRLVKFKRKYGYSYPILLKSTSPTSFQGCRTPVLLDFILQYDDGSLAVSSSDDWVKVDE